MPRPGVKPQLSLLKRTGQARVGIIGKDFFCGLWGTREVQKRGDELISEWILKRSPDRMGMPVDELAVRFMKYAKGYFVKNGRPTSEVHTFRAALGFICRRFKRDRAAEFSPLKLKAAREDMIRSGLSRQTILKYQARILAVWKWAVSEELVRPEVWQAPPVLPVPEKIVNQTLPHMPRVVADMVRLQLRTGMRPAEVATLTPGDIDRGGAVWVYVVRDHKTAHRGKDRKVFIGPMSQAILAPYLDGKPDMPCFRVSPRPEASAYPTAAYRRAITRACELAFGMPKELRAIPTDAERDDKARRQRGGQGGRESRLTQRGGPRAGSLQYSDTIGGHTGRVGTGSELWNRGLPLCQRQTAQNRATRAATVLEDHRAN